MTEMLIAAAVGCAGLLVLAWRARDAFTASLGFCGLVFLATAIVADMLK